MEPIIGGGTDPAPYIFGAYLVCSLLLLGFGLQVQRHRGKLRTLLSAIRKH